MKTPATFKEQVKSHPLDVDSDSEVRLAVPLRVHRWSYAVTFKAGAQMTIADRENVFLVLGNKTIGTVALSKRVSLNASQHLKSVCYLQSG